jgi:hypothetical protein
MVIIVMNMRTIVLNGNKSTILDIFNGLNCVAIQVNVRINGLEREQFINCADTGKDMSIYFYYLNGATFINFLWEPILKEGIRFQL